MATVKDLIEQLSEIADKDQPIIFQYWLADDFEYHDETPTPTQEQFAEVSERLHPDFLWAEAREVVNDELYDLVRESVEEDEEDEDEDE